LNFRFKTFKCLMKLERCSLLGSPIFIFSCCSFLVSFQLFVLFWVCFLLFSLFFTILSFFGHLTFFSWAQEIFLFRSWFQRKIFTVGLCFSIGQDKQSQHLHVKNFFNGGWLTDRGWGQFSRNGCFHPFSQIV